jgi:glycosyltransferase involved in cell wall biosynthesis
MKILLVGHACAPNRGSEPGLTWQFAWHLSQLHEVWVMTNSRFKDSIEQQLVLTPNNQLHFIWVLPPEVDPKHKTFNERSLRFHYIFWQRAVLREAARQHRIHEFDLVHHLSWGTISAPPLLWRLPIPLVWGPVGGAQTTPRAYLRYLGPAWARELLRTVRVRLVTRMPALRRTVQNCALILSTNPETTQALHAAGARHVNFYPNIGVTEELLAAPLRKHTTSQREPIILWAGRLIPIKALPLALEVMTQIKPGMRARLRVLGEGPVKADMEKLARELGVADRVDFLGAVPWAEMKRHYNESTVFVFTSLRDSSGAVLAEALASGLPIVTLDHQGAGAIVPADAGIKVRVKNPPETVRDLAEAIERVITHPELREEMSKAARAHAQSLSWNTHAEAMTKWYEQVLANDAEPQTDYAYASI